MPHWAVLKNLQFWMKKKTSLMSIFILKKTKLFLFCFKISNLGYTVLNENMIIFKILMILLNVKKFQGNSCSCRFKCNTIINWLITESTGLQQYYQSIMINWWKMRLTLRHTFLEKVNIILLHFRKD